ncbi:MAG: 5-methyltetrahydropteroyltriglutamate--homocysteine S-methyltransferase [Prevotella sp.]
MTIRLNTQDLKTNVLGYPRIGKDRELKRALESFWAGRSTREELEAVAKELRKENWTLMQEAGIDLIPSNDFSYYDTVLDQTLAVGAIPARYDSLKDDKLNLYFAMAHGYQKDGNDVIAMEMTKWFDTNYHYIVPEFTKDQTFSYFDTKAVDEFIEAKKLGIITKPVLIGPVSFLLLGKEKEEGFHRLDLLERLLPVYARQLSALQQAGARWIQLDEPVLVTDLDERAQEAFRKAYAYLSAQSKLNIILTSYFGSLGNNEALALSLPVKALHVDLVRGPEQIEVIKRLPKDKILSLGLIDGRNIWKNDLEASHNIAHRAICQLGFERVILSTSCSLLHVPYDLEQEHDEKVLPQSIKRFLAFAKQKVEELALLKAVSQGLQTDECIKAFVANQRDIEAKRESEEIHDAKVKERLANIQPEDYQRHSDYAHRSKQQHERLQLPLFPTTTIGSFPQTKEVRSWRAAYKKGRLTKAEYENLLKEEIKKCVAWQEKAGLDVLVHGEFERNDMVEYFGEQLKGFTFTQKGWVQSYGSRCVKPPIIYGDVSRPQPMTVAWSSYAQSLTKRPMKGMLTGPVTILEWSFVRNDQPLSVTCQQIALAIRDEVVDLEKAGISVIQIDEPAIREGLPLRHAQWEEYLQWAVDSFRLTASGVKDETQIHTHMCYSEFNDIIAQIARMDADVITIECSRSQMELLDVFRQFQYPNEIGPGVYDIHSARIPSVDEMVALLKKAAALIPQERLWVNPDCGLKTRGWEETRPAIANMVEAAKVMRKNAKV